ncbi:hypothetical protein [Prevotella sp. P5-50]|uniref:hypothetical protein n=1 Tax=Prevotella sp. P5-50 TaxID=2024217 RepID=UPI000B9711BE|nr:hypothetical protein [Prevotella sp. P5-50]OYP41296.1 hypothetical protein CIK88_06705 [Prevotella sp. P5-50]
MGETRQTIVFYNSTDRDIPFLCAKNGFDILYNHWMFGTFFFGIGGTYAFVRDLIYNIKGRCWVLILNEGLLIGKTLIHWENIEGFGKWNGGVLVFTNNVEERLAAANLIKRWNMKLSIKMSKTDILAPELGFEGSCNDFIAQCEEELIKFKNK